MSRIYRQIPAWFGCLPLALLASLINLPTLQAEETADKGQVAAEKMEFIRLLRDDDKTPLALQTAIVRYRPANGDPNGPTVDLIGAVHVGDRVYYDSLNKEFEQYESLLYELVAPKQAKIPRGTKAGGGAVAALQNGLKSLLELEHQLEIVDYTAKNFVHADMSPDEFAQKMSERNESFFKMFVRIMTESMAMQAKGAASAPSDLELIMALFDKDRSNKLKVIMAEQFSGMEAMMTSLSGPDGSTIITECNKVALAVLADQLKEGRKKVGIFYGAGHLKDMDERLRNEFKLVPTETRWMTAWDLKPKQR